MPDERIGKRGTAQVTWHGGHVTESEGEIIAIVEDANEVYLETLIGPVVGELDTLEIVDEPG